MTVNLNYQPQYSSGNQKLTLPILSVYYFIIVAIIWGNQSIFTQLAKIIIVGSTGLCILSSRYNHPKISKTYIWWNILCGLYFASTYFWSYDEASTVSMSITYGYVCICCSCIFFLISYSKNYIYLCFRMFMISSLIMATYIILRFGIGLTGSEREFYAQYGFNLNTIGMTSAIAGIIAYYFYKSNILKKRNKYKWIVLFSLFIVLITGSKKALFLPLIVFGVYWFFKVSPLRRVFVICGIIVVICGLYYTIMRIPILYDILGNRIEGMLNGFMGKGSVDGSTMARLQFIEYGMLLIEKKFWTGYGLASFTHLHAYARPDEYASYSHNNYIELMVSGGFIGTFIYYSIYLLLLTKLHRLIVKYKDELSLFCFAMLIGLLFIQYGMVSYYDWPINILVTLIAVYTYQRYSDISSLKLNYTVS